MGKLSTKALICSALLGLNIGAALVNINTSLETEHNRAQIVEKVEANQMDANQAVVELQDNANVGLMSMFAVSLNVAAICACAVDLKKEKDAEKSL